MYIGILVRTLVFELVCVLITHKVCKQFGYVFWFILPPYTRKMRINLNLSDISFCCEVWYNYHVLKGSREGTTENDNITSQVQGIQRGE